MDNLALYSKLSSLPEKMKSEVADFIDFLLSKSKSEQKKRHTGKAQFGSGKGMFTITPDFDDPLEDFKEYM